jgi:heterotetrameric sarcosine oxidase delta subunit
MFEIECPYCGKRDQSEFSHAGEAHVVRPSGDEEINDAQWAEFVFMRRNSKGVLAERWVHSAGCRKFFNMLRNTATDQILAVYKMGEDAPKVDHVAALPSPSGESLGSGNDAVQVMNGDET